ncbi:MAG TPA: HNH endonuclease [Ktedonobacterales bacterium]
MMLDDLDLPAVGDLRSAFSAVDEARVLRETVEANAVEALERVHDAVVTLALQVGDDTDLTSQVIQYLYWMEPDIKVAWLAEAFNLKQHQVVQLAGQASLPLTCSRCGSEYRIIVNSRTEMQGRQRRSWWGSNGIHAMCAQCREVVMNEQHKRAAAEQATRDARLEQLRTMPYREYLKTPEWQDRRVKQLRRAGFRCQVCNASRTQLNVHHRTYERRGIEDFKDLIVLCSDCHALFHAQGKLAREE